MGCSSSSEEPTREPQPVAVERKKPRGAACPPSSTAIPQHNNPQRQNQPPIPPSHIHHTSRQTSIESKVVEPMTTSARSSTSIEPGRLVFRDSLTSASIGSRSSIFSTAAAASSDTILSCAPPHAVPCPEEPEARDEQRPCQRVICERQHHPRPTPQEGIFADLREIQIVKKIEAKRKYQRRGAACVLLPAKQGVNDMEFYHAEMAQLSCEELRNPHAIFAYSRGCIEFLNEPRRRCTSVRRGAEAASRRRQPKGVRVTFAPGQQGL